MALFQDSRGLIWIGTRGGGLVEFDGENYRQVSNQEAGYGDFISDIQELPDGRLVLALTYSGLEIYDNHKFHRIKKNWVSYNHEFHKIVQLKSRLYVIGDQSVVGTGYDSLQTRSLFQYPEKISSLKAASGLGNRWIIFSVDSGLWVLDTKAMARTMLLSKNKELKGKEIIGLNPISEREMALISKDGKVSILSFPNDWPELEAWTGIPGLSLADGEYISCLQFGPGQLIKWLGTSKRRIISSNGQALDLKNIKEGSFHELNTLLSDRNGAIWIGTAGSGLLIKQPYTSYSFGNHPELKNSNLKAVTIDPKGRLLAGGNESGLLVKENPNEVNSPLTVHLKGQSISGLGNWGDYIMVGKTTGFQILDSKTFKTLKSFDLGAKTLIFKEITKNRLLVSTYGKGLWMLKPDFKLEKVDSEGGELSYPYGFEEKISGQWWIPSNTGLWLFDEDSMKATPVQVPGELGGSFFHIVKDAYQNIWLSHPNGLATKQGNEWKVISQKNGLSSKLIYTLNADALGNLWVGTKKG